MERDPDYRESFQRKEELQQLWNERQAMPALRRGEPDDIDADVIEMGDQDPNGVSPAAH